MPSRYERCVKKVKARGDGVNPFAVCRHALNRTSKKMKRAARATNPIPMGHGAVEGVKWGPLLIILGGAVAVGTAIVLAAKPAPAAQSPQKQPPTPPPGAQVYGLNDSSTYQALSVNAGGWGAVRFCGYVECGPIGGQFTYCDTIGCATIYELLSLYQQYVQSNGIGGFAMYYWICTQDLNGPCP